jgi:hypothetical protein
MRSLVLAAMIALGCAPIAHSSPQPAGIVCDMLRKYPVMGPVDVALTFVEDQHLYRSYDAARAVVDKEVMSECPELATRGR